MDNYSTQEMKSKPIYIISSPKQYKKNSDINTYEYNETSFDPWSSSPPPDANPFINKLELRYEKLNKKLNKN
jgi:hypothetical protein